MKYMFLRYPEGKTKAVTLSYDDGHRDDLKLLEIINKFNVKCTFNFTNFSKITDEEIKENLFRNGHEIAVHGAQHLAPAMTKASDGIQQIIECRKNLEKRFNRIIRGMAYPDSGITKFSNGASYESIRSYLSDLGIVYSRTAGSDNNEFMLPTDWYAWMPTAKHTNPQLFDYVKEFTELDVNNCYCAARYPRLFYLWGHSFEFSYANNWDILEKFCEKISGKDDIWYATNIEIFDYVTAYNSLVFSMDSMMIYNPTLIKIWFDFGGKLYSINPGETLHIDEE